MTYRTRLTLALFATAAVALTVLGFGVLREMTDRADADAAQRTLAVQADLTARLSEQRAADRARLSSLAADLAADNRFRAAGIASDRRWLLDWAQSHMAPAGFVVLQLQDADGRILSSGQFRNDFDRAAAVITAPTVMDARTPDGSVRALVTAVGFTVRGQRFTLTGGTAFDSTRVRALSSDAAIAAVLAHDDATEGVIAATLPYLSDSSAASERVRVVLVPDESGLRALKAGVTRWLAVAIGGTLLVAIVIASMLGHFVAAPIERLAAKTTILEREAERVAATGELARQVNHDIKNGLAPIRNVLRHLSQVAEREPDTLASIYSERRATLDSSVDYLDDLARTYAKLSPATRRGMCDPIPVIRAVARSEMGASVVLRLPDALPAVRIDAVALRRILDNLVSNAVDALEGEPGSIMIRGEVVDKGAGPLVRISVADTGRGMTDDELGRAFDDFYTTKPKGTGLGLSVVRRLLMDAGGSVRAHTAPGLGSTFTVDIPAAEEAATAA